MRAIAVVGRDEEIGSIQAFVADIKRGPERARVVGEAGIGKTILWKAGIEMAHPDAGSS